MRVVMLHPVTFAEQTYATRAKLHDVGPKSRLHESKRAALDTPNRQICCLGLMWAWETLEKRLGMIVSFCSCFALRSYQVLYKHTLLVLPINGGHSSVVSTSLFFDRFDTYLPHTACPRPMPDLGFPDRKSAECPRVSGFRAQPQQPSRSKRPTLERSEQNIISESLEKRIGKAINSQCQNARTDGGYPDPTK